MRALIIDRAAGLLAASPVGDISTRAVCEAAGVTQPVLYRLFGDKDGLLAAVADAAWEDYLSGKRAAEASADPLQDLRAGWDAHTAFALANPHAYRLVFASLLGTRTEAPNEAMRLLEGVLARLAAQGRLRMRPQAAARVVMAANSGVALGLVLRPEQYPDPDASAQVREATLRSLMPDDAPFTSGADAAATAAATLLARLDAGAAGEVGGEPPFTVAEAGLLREWLGRFEAEPGTGRPGP